MPLGNSNTSISRNFRRDVPDSRARVSRREAEPQSRSGNRRHKPPALAESHLTGIGAVNNSVGSKLVTGKSVLKYHHRPMVPAPALLLHIRCAATFVLDPSATRLANNRFPVPVETVTKYRMNAKIFITGGAGFIGSRLADELLAQGYCVRALDNLSPQVRGKRAEPPEYLSQKVEFIRGDARDAAAV